MSDSDSDKAMKEAFDLMIKENPTIPIEDILIGFSAFAASVVFIGYKEVVGNYLMKHRRRPDLIAPIWHKFNELAKGIALKNIHADMLKTLKDDTPAFAELFAEDVTEEPVAPPQAEKKGK